MVNAAVTGVLPGAGFHRALVEAGLLLPMGVEGLCGWSAAFEDTVIAVGGLVSEAGAGESTARVQFPPIMPQGVLERTGYLRSFPHLTGSVHIFLGDDGDHAALLRDLGSGADWTRALAPSGAVLRPAACHPLYPLCTGRLAGGERRFAVSGWCFRHEPAVDPARLQAFRMHEVVYLGDAAGAARHRDIWVERGVELLAGLGLEVEAVAANDPFFGRAGRMLAATQRDAATKVELTATVSGGEPTALVSSNLHGDHFGSAFAIETAPGEVAHSACVGFGLERITLALLARHGLDPRRWPAAVRVALGP